MFRSIRVKYPVHLFKIWRRERMFLSRRQNSKLIYIILVFGLLLLSVRIMQENAAYKLRFVLESGVRNETKKFFSCKHTSSSLLVDVNYNVALLEKTVLNTSQFKKTWNVTKPAITTDERQTMQMLLKEFIKICDIYKITDYFIFSGSLLGSYRHHGLQPWDDDIDIWMNYWNRDSILTAFKEFRNKSKEFVGVPDRWGMKFYHQTKSIEIEQYYHRWPYLDIAFYHENISHIWEVKVYKQKMYKSNFLPKSLIFPLHMRPFEMVLINSPRDAFAVLKLLYNKLGCVSLIFNHKLERFVQQDGGGLQFDCRDTASIYPFVHRKPSSCGGVEETLILNGTILYTILVEEPTYAISIPYVLELTSLNSSSGAV